MTSPMMMDSPYAHVHDLNPEQIDDLHGLYQKEWWTQTRCREELETMLANSDVVHGLVDPATGALVAFARALTDGIYKAVVFDVIVAEAHRGKGCGRILMDTLLERPELLAVKHVELFCKPPEYLYHFLTIFDQVGSY